MWVVKLSDGTVIGRGRTFRAAAIEALEEELFANGISKRSVTEHELQGALDANHFYAHDEKRPSNRFKLNPNPSHNTTKIRPADLIPTIVSYYHKNKRWPDVEKPFHISVHVGGRKVPATARLTRTVVNQAVKYVAGQYGQSASLLKKSNPLIDPDTLGVTERIVTEPKGSWKWQDAFSVATYKVHRGKDGKLRWKSTGRSRKMSLPQLRAAGLDHLQRGSLHNKPYTGRE